MGRPQHGGNLIWAANIAGCPTFSVLDFSASINPYGISHKVLNAITEGISQLKHYPSPDYADLRACLGEYHGLSPDYILPGNGSAELLTWAARDLAQKDATYLVTPAFGDYYRALMAFKANIVRLASVLPLEDLGSILGNLLTSDRGLLLNNPHNPTGKLWDRQEVVDCLHKFALVVVDEAFMDFLPEARQQSLINLIADYPNLIILRSLTKFYSLPGLRIGYAIAHPDRLQRWQKYRDPWSVNSLAVVAAIAAVQDKEFQKFTWNWLTPARNNLTEGLGNIPEFEPLPSAANFLLVKSSVSVTNLQLQLLKKHQILIRDCLSFAELGDNYFRIAVRTPEENNYLLTSLEDVIKEISS
ncbi:MAG: threonine-phosphate decarboxylase CobD [Xenococcaceae cyanobacterium MO_188.B19]|nr:threonine-phosphate decarboxylase CobD [Xenococcaceae cyanobacterium MO_188.B19]